MKSTLISTPVIIVSAIGLLSVIVIVTLFVPPQGTQSEPVSPVDKIEAASSVPDSPAEVIEIVAERPETSNVEFTLQTVTSNGKLGYIGIGGEIDGVTNTDLNVHLGDVIHLTLLNGDGMPHDLFLPDFDVKAPYVTGIGDQAEIVFKVGDMPAGTYAYYCTVPGHRQLGQEGRLIVREVSK